MGLTHIHNGVTDWFGTRDGLTGETVHSIFEDREGTIWAATPNGLDRFRESAVTAISADQGLSSSSVDSVFPAADGGVWIGTAAGLNKWNERGVTVYGGPRPSLEDRTRSRSISRVRAEWADQSQQRMHEKQDGEEQWRPEHVEQHRARAGLGELAKRREIPIGVRRARRIAAAGMVETGGQHGRPQPVLEPDEYARVLFRAGFAEPKVRLIVYPHVLASRDEVVNWMKGSLLTEYQKRLAPEQFAAFTSAYRDRLLPQLDAERPFLFPFKRILCWGRKGV